MSETIRANFVHYILYGTFAALTIAQAIAGSMPSFVWIAGLVLLAIGFNFAILEAKIAGDQLVLRFGLFRTTIPVAQIEAAVADTYSAWRFGGWGMRIAGGVTLYNVMGDGGKAVRVQWKDKSGHMRTTMFSSRKAEEWAQRLSDIGRSSVASTVVAP